MLRFAADENFDGRIVRGLRRRRPELDVVRVQDTVLVAADDDAVLAWAADEGRLVLTHDVATMSAAAWRRVRAGVAMPGLVEVGRDVPIGQAIDDLLAIAELSRPDENEGRVIFLPL